jgi:hypothetical protein
MACYGTGSFLLLLLILDALQYEDLVRFEVTMKNAVFWNVSPFGSCKNQHSGGT